jgi:spore maturation protein CgeB
VNPETANNQNEYTLSVRVARNNEATLCAAFPDGTQHFYHSSYNPSREAARRVRTDLQNAQPVILILGLGLGYELKAVRDLMPSFDQIHVVESSPESFSFFRTMPLAEDLLNDPRIFFHIKDTMSGLDGMFKELAVHASTVIENPITQHITTDFYTQLKERLSFAPQTRYHFALLVGKGVATPFIVNDIATTLMRSGHTVTLLPLCSDRPSKRMDTFDYLLSLDYAGFNIDWVQELPCRKITWFVDNPTYFIESVNKDVLVFCWDREYLARLKKMGFVSVFYMPLATNPHIFKPFLLSNEQLTKYKADVSFVGSISYEFENKENYFNQLFMQQYSAEFQHSVIEGAHHLNRAVLCGETRSPDDLYLQQSPETQKKIDLFNDIIIGNALREQVIQAASAFQLSLYGSPSLKRYQTLSVQYRGPVDYHSELPLVYNATDINLNVSRPQLITTVNQRVFDIAACNQFFLSDYRAVLREIFPDCAKDISYRSIAEIQDKIDYYLLRPDERKDIAEYMYHVVKKEHTYMHRLDSMLDILSASGK